MAQFLQVFADLAADQPGTSDDDDFHDPSPEAVSATGIKHPPRWQYRALPGSGRQVVESPAASGRNTSYLL